MKGDFTRNTFRPERHFSSVRMQQGRVQVDADWNEAEDIRLRLERIEGVDVIGGCGTPAGAPGFGISFAGSGFKIGSGRYYVDGILCENDAAVDFDGQKDYPGATDPTTGTQLFYLDVWEEHVTALEDPLIREVALNGPDTGTRVRVVWQVKAWAVTGGVTTCEAAFEQLPASTDATLRARAKTPDDTEACTVKPGSSYKRLENQLYRVEVHKPGDLSTATFKWSRDNGSVVTGFQIADGHTLTVDSVGRDQMLSFASGQWVEVTDRRRELLALQGDFFSVTRVDGNNLILDSGGPAVNAANYGEGMKVRRWDSQADVKFANLDADGYMSLEDGVQVMLAGTDFRTGDYWLIPARTVTGDVEWPKTGTTPNALPPLGIVHYRCPLAIATQSGASWTIEDCRNPFVPLTQVLAMYYLAGDGQTVTPNPQNLAATLPVPEPPTVGVSRGEVPVAGATIRFSTVHADNSTTVLGTVDTTANGTASYPWALNSTDKVQRLRAELLDSEGDPTHLPITFTATLNTADQVAYTPGCPDLAGMVTVQAALDELCKHRGSVSCCKSVGPGGDFETIEEAIKAYREDPKMPGLCLCLLPGKHPWPGEFPNLVTDAGRPSVTITGIRGASTIVAEGPIEIQGLTDLVITDLIIEAGSGVSLAEIVQVDFEFVRLNLQRQFKIEGVGEFRMDDCDVDFQGNLTSVGCDTVVLRSLRGTLNVDGHAISIEKSTSVTVEHCQLQVYTAQWNGAALRLANCKRANVLKNLIRVRRVNKDATKVNVSTAPPQKAVGDLLQNVSTTDAQAPAKAAKALLGSAPTDRTNAANQISRFLADNALMLTPETSTSLASIGDVLRDPNATADKVQQAIAGFQTVVGSDASSLATANFFGVALMLVDGRGFYNVNGNQFAGFVVLYGELGVDRLTSDWAKRLIPPLRQFNVDWGIGTLNFSENQVLTVLLAEDFTNPNGTILQALLKDGSLAYPVFRNSTFSQNMFVTPPFELLSNATTFSGNVLNQANEYAGVVLGDRATYTGNIAYGGMMLFSATQDHADAANISLTFA